jgi:hypothetical protein
MTLHVLPEVGHWYSQRGRATLFQVVAYDEDGWVEIQDEDGDVDELDLEAWRALPIQPAAAPEEWIGSDDERDDEDPSYGARGDRLDPNQRTAIERLSTQVDTGLEFGEPDGLEDYLGA